MSNLPKRAQQLRPRLLLIHHDKLELIGGSLDVAHLSPVWRRVVTLVTILIAMATFSSKPNLGIFPGEKCWFCYLEVGARLTTGNVGLVRRETHLVFIKIRPNGGLSCIHNVAKLKYICC